MEIERKWLVKKENIPYNLDTLESFDIEQAYISFDPAIRIRKINDYERCILTVKSGTLSAFVREEFETDISAESYNNLIRKAEGTVITKRRYLNKRDDGLLEEIDVFSGELEGLCYLEIEFESEKQCVDFETPDWVYDDVTEKDGFSNAELAKNGMPSVAE